jgi:translation elongation factor EF-Tu-like GTPase
MLDECGMMLQNMKRGDVERGRLLREGRSNEARK